MIEANLSEEMCYQIGEKSSTQDMDAPIKFLFQIFN